MSYYTGVGDYYSGTGDPGIFGGIWGAIKGGVKGLITGGPTGALTGAIRGGVAGLRGTPPPTAAIERVQRLPTPRMQIQEPTWGQRIRVAGQALAPGGVEPFYQNGAACQRPGTGGRAYHYNKALARYERAREQGKDVMDPRSRPRVVNTCVKNRSMNPTNPKALRRAIRREAAFIGLAKRALKGSGYTFKKTGAPTRRRRRKRK